MQLPWIIGPPLGRAWLALVPAGEGREQVAGTISLRASGDGCDDLRRLFVRPAFRRRGVGVALVLAAIAAVPGRTLRAEVPVTLHQAASVLRRAGFQASPPWHAIPSAWGPTQFLVLSNPAL